MTLNSTVVPLRRAEPVARWLDERAEELADELADAVCSQVPSYRESRDVVRAQVHQHARDVWSTFTRHIREGGPGAGPQVAEFDATARQASHRVRAGIPIADFLQAFRVGEQVLWRQVQTAVRETHTDDGVALALAETVMRTIEVASTVGLEHWLVAHQHELEQDARWRRELLDEVLAGRGLEDDGRRLALAELGLDRHYVVMSVCGDGADDTELSALAHELGGGLRGIGSLSAVRRTELVALLALDGPVAPLVDKLRRVVGERPQLRAGVSAECTSLGDASAAYLEARLARDAVRRTGPLLALGDLSLLERLALHHSDLVDRVVDRRWTGVLVDDMVRAGGLVATLEVFGACDMNVRDTAERMHIHTNTVYYRLDRLTERLGVDVRKVSQLMDVLVALRLIEASTPRQVRDV